MASPRTLPSIDPAAITRARAAGVGIVKRTPVLSSLTISERAGGTVAVKAENLQRTGSFKLRGVLAKLDALGSECARGVTAGSAGNHAQALARGARERGVPCEVFMPAEAPIAKAEAATALGATVHLGGDSVDDCVAAARSRAEEAGMIFVHPFDDAYVVAGQATLGLELVEDVEDLARVVVPVGGGGLASGVAIAVKSARPDVQVFGVRATERNGPTIADGIAVKAPGALTGPMLERWLDGMVEVGESETAEAMVLLLERSKLVVEGAGAVGVAALLSSAVAPAPSGTTVAVLSGGNVDAGLLATIARRQETQAGRRLALMTRVPDRPGALAKLLGCVADTGANLVEVSHVREGVDLHVRETAVELVIETRGAEHAERVLAALEAGGYGTAVKR
jgi:threonine dehydratase